MINLTYNNDIKEFSENILKISTYLDWLFKEREQENEPLPILNCSDNIFKIFSKWFNKLELKGIVSYDIDFATVIFCPEFFENYNVETLVEVFNLGFANQIKMLCETVAYVIGLKCDIIKFNEKYYTTSKSPETINGKCYFKSIELHESLAIMILKNMSLIKFNLQQSDMKQLLTFEPKEIIPYCNFIDKITKDNIISKHADWWDGEAKYVVLSYSITHIPDGAFDYAEEFHELPELYIEIPNSVIEIGCQAFGHFSLKYIGLPETNISIENYAFCKLYSQQEIIYKNVLYKAPIKSVEYKIPDCITTIDGYAFCNCDSLTTVEIPESVTNIGINAFRNCNKLQLIHNNILYRAPTNTITYSIPDNVKEISTEAFKDCYKLTHVNIPNSVTKIGYYAFYNCELLENINIPRTVETVCHSAFRNCNSLTNETRQELLNRFGFVIY